MANPIKFSHLFESTTPSKSVTTVGVNDPSYIRIDCPRVLHDMMLCLIENEGLRVDDKDAGDEDNCYFTIGTDYNVTHLQMTLRDLKIPHTFTVENNHEEYESNHFRYINGSFMYTTSYENADLISAYHVLELLEQQAYTALRIYAENHKACAEYWEFTEEDIKQAKVLALQWTVKP